MFASVRVRRRSVRWLGRHRVLEFEPKGRQDSGLLPLGQWMRFRPLEERVDRSGEEVKTITWSVLHWLPPLLAKLIC